MFALIVLIICLFVFAHLNPVLFGILFILGIVITPWIFHAIRKSDEKIVSAEVIERIQVMREEYRHSGFSIGLHGNPRMYWRTKEVPSYVKAKIAVTYDDGRHRVLTLTEGGLRYNRVMAMGGAHKGTKSTAAPLPAKPPATSVPEVEYIDVRPNQLVAGVYVIGDAIPEGNYDLRWIWGSGSVSKYVDDTTTLGASNFFGWVGNTHDYEQRVIVNMVCKTGEHLRIDGNLIVEIRKSKPVILDLDN